MGALVYLTKAFQRSETEEVTGRNEREQFFPNLKLIYLYFEKAIIVKLRMWRHLVRMYNLVAADLKALPFEPPGESQWLNGSCLYPLKRSPLRLLCRV